MSLNKHVTYFLWILRLHVYTTCISLNTVKNSLQVYDSNMGMILNKKYMCFKFLMKNLQYSLSWREFDFDLQLGGSMTWLTTWWEYMYELNYKLEGVWLDFRAVRHGIKKFGDRDSFLFDLVHRSGIRDFSLDRFKNLPNMYKQKWPPVDAQK